MNRKIILVVVVSVVVGLAAVMAVGAQGPKPREPQAVLGPGFTYQGQLKRNGLPVSEACSMQFSLFDTSLGGTQIGITQSVPSVSVVNGLFTTLVNSGNEFGAGAFNGQERWLQVQLQCASDNSPTTLLRQQLSSVPYAAYAAGNWALNGNANSTPGTNFLGTSNNQALELKVNNQRALRIEPATGSLPPYALYSPNLIGGLSTNSVAPGVVAATIGGGGIVLISGTVVQTATQIISGFAGTIGGGFGNIVSDTEGTIAGGVDNLAGRSGTVGGGVVNVASGSYSTVGGGQDNTASGDDATVAGGAVNTAAGTDAAIGGGYSNTVPSTASRSVIGGGEFNLASGHFATIPGGSRNVASGDNSFAAGQQANTNNQAGAFVWGDDSTQQVISATAPNQFLVRAAGFVGINTNNPTRDLTISSASTFVTGIDLYNTTSAPGTTGYRMQVNGSSVTGRVGNFELWNSALMLTVQPGGNIGLGVNSPTNRLTLPNTADTGGRGLANAWNVYSSRRWKSNIATIDDALGKVERLRGVTFDWTSNGKPDIGLVAEEVGQVVPEVVTWEPNGIDAQSVDYSRLVALLIEAVKQQQGQIARQQKTLDALQSAPPPAVAAPAPSDPAVPQEVALLRAQNAALEARVAALEQASPKDGGMPAPWLLAAGAVVIGVVAWRRRT